MDGTLIDVTTARREHYPRPGQLPVIETPASIEDDLLRRDFTVNAMALRLDGEAALLDPADGMGDIGRRTIRVLHGDSFRDDATRIYRAYRFAARLGFSIDPATERLIGEGLEFVDSIGGERLRREIDLTFGEANGGRALKAAHAAGAIVALYPALSWDAARTNALEAHVARSVTPALGWALLAARVSREEAEAVCRRLRLTRHSSEAVRGMAALRGVGATLRRGEAKPSGVVMLLDRYPVASVEAFAVTSDDAIARRLALDYLDTWRHQKPLLRGDELRELGVPEGPEIQKALQLIRAARLDGWASDRDDERALALRFAKSIRDAQAAHTSIEMHTNGH
jgi:tRNA nucleotidyltransferase (CCA-adding enzyme)